MKDTSTLFCNHIHKLTAYTPIEPPDQIASRLGLPEEAITKLDANENPYGTTPEVRDAISKGKYYHIYPDPAQSVLRKVISNYSGCKPANVIAGTGADELIDLICRLVIEPDDKVLTFTPTFSYYNHVLTLNRAQLVTYPRESNFSLSLEKIKEIPLEGIKLVILCSPNNPTGNLLEAEVLDYFLKQDLLVLVDEAYYEFAGLTFAAKLEEHQNLIVLRTFSKCFGLAGLRVGYGLMSPVIADALMKIKPPYSVNVAAEIALQSCLENLDYYNDLISKITSTRDSFIEQLQNIKQLQPFPSFSNFILCRVTNYSAKLLHSELEKRGLLVRYFDNSELRDYFRISIGTEEQMENLLSSLFDLLK